MSMYYHRLVVWQEFGLGWLEVSMAPTNFTIPNDLKPSKFFCNSLTGFPQDHTQISVWLRKMEYSKCLIIFLSIHSDHFSFVNFLLTRHKIYTPYYQTALQDGKSRKKKQEIKGQGYQLMFKAHL